MTLIGRRFGSAKGNGISFKATDVPAQPKCVVCGRWIDESKPLGTETCSLACRRKRCYRRRLGRDIADAVNRRLNPKSANHKSSEWRGEEREVANSRWDGRLARSAR